MAATACPACGATAFVGDGAGGGTCSRCGYASGESNRCPHCGATARTEGSGDAVVCAVCGGPRIPNNHGGERAAAALKEQKRHLVAARNASLATVVQGIFATLVTLFGLLIMPASIAGKVIVFAIAVAPLLLSLRSRSRATDAREKAKEASERAWQAAAEAIASGTKGGVTASSLAKTLEMDAPRAERLLTSLAVHDRTRVDVGDDAEVRYSVTPQERIRVDDNQTDLDDVTVADEREPARKESRTP